MDGVICGDCLEEMPKIDDNSIDAIVTDPPAAINFMQKSWDSDKGGRTQWIAWMSRVAAECLRVIKPGGHALVWALPRTSHWTGMAWEEAGWEPRDKISHVFGSGFPKSLSIDKAIDRHFKAEREVIGSNPNVIRESKIIGNSDYGGFNKANPDITAPATPEAQTWAGFGTSLKPAYESWWLFQKPLNTHTALDSNIARIKTLEVELCRLKSSVKIAEKSSTSNLRDLGVELDSAQWTAEEKNSIQDALSAQMDMSLLESAMISSLNIVLSWKSILEDLSTATKTSTIETAIDQIIDWKTLNYYLSVITPAYIILARLNLLGQNSPVLTVVESLNAELSNLNGILTLSARTTAICRESNSLRKENGVLHEDWWLFRKPLACKTIAENVLEWGCGGLNIDASRIATDEIAKVVDVQRPHASKGVYGDYLGECKERNGNGASSALGRFPANLIWSHSPLCTDAACHPSCPSWEFAKARQTTYSDKRTCKIQRTPRNDGSGAIYGKDTNLDPQPCYGDTGSPARFFKSCQFTDEDIPAFAYFAKASKSERGEGNNHPTVKSLSLMRYLVKLITPPGGLILDPFAGSGTTLLAAKHEGFRFIGIEKEAEYCDICRKRIAAIPASLDKWL